MNPNLKTSLPLLILTGCFAGCSPDLGDFKYVGQRPSIKLTVVSQKYEPAKETYESSKLELSGVSQQTKAFPVKHYGLSVVCEGKLSNDKPIKCSLAIEMKDGAGSFTETTYLDRGMDTPNLKLVSLTVKETNWTPFSAANVEIEVKD